MICAKYWYMVSKYMFVMSNIRIGAIKIAIIQCLAFFSACSCFSDIIFGAQKWMVSTFLSVICSLNLSFHLQIVLYTVMSLQRFEVLGMTADDFRVCIKAVINMVGDRVGEFFIIPVGDILPERRMLVIERKKS